MDAVVPMEETEVISIVPMVLGRVVMAVMEEPSLIVVMLMAVMADRSSVMAERWCSFKRWCC